MIWDDITTYMNNDIVSVPLRGNVNNDVSDTFGQPYGLGGFRPLTGKCK